jgi:hypothetical protein
VTQIWSLKILRVKQAREKQNPSKIKGLTSKRKTKPIKEEGNCKNDHIYRNRHETRNAK